MIKLIGIILFSGSLWAINCADYPTYFFKNFTDSKLTNLGTYDFGKLAYSEATVRLKKQLDDMVEEVKGDPARYAILQSHQQHLENLISAVDSNAQRLADDGVNIERLKAAIYSHDIGKFVPADDKVRLHYAFRSFEGKDPQALVDYVKGQGKMSTREAEDLLEDLWRDRKLTSLNRLFDMPKYRFLKDSLMEDKDYINFFAEFMDHSQTSREWLRAHALHGANKSGGPDNLTRQLMLDSVGHDGPSSTHSFWGQMYGTVTGMTYPNPKTVEGQVLQLVDRLDQAGAVVRGNILSGGPRKIGYQVSGQYKGAELIDYSINNVVDGTEDQVRYIQRNLGANIPGNLDKLIEQNIVDYRRLRAATVLYDIDGTKGALPIDSAIGEIKIDGVRYYFNGLEEYYGTDKVMGAATVWWLKNIP